MTEINKPASLKDDISLEEKHPIIQESKENNILPINKAMILEQEKMTSIMHHEVLKKLNPTSSKNINGYDHPEIPIFYNDRNHDHAFFNNTYNSKNSILNNSDNLSLTGKAIPYEKINNDYKSGNLKRSTDDIKVNTILNEENINTKKHKKDDYNHPENPIPYNENDNKYEVLNNIKSVIPFIAKEIINGILYSSGNKSAAIVTVNNYIPVNDYDIYFQIKKVDRYLFILYYYPSNILKYFVVRIDLPETCLESNLKTVCEYIYESYNIKLSSINSDTINFPYKRHFYTPDSGWKLINQNLIILYNEDKFLLVPKNMFQESISVHMVEDNKLINEVINTSLEKIKKTENNDTVPSCVTEIYNSVRNYIGSLFS
jgi:hypothetical protein